MKPTQARDSRTELTVRGVLIGIAITVVFTAANVYFGLKAGLTFATSIPAAVISMAVLRGFRNATIQENNIVQTVASSAGTQSAIIFVLPGLVMVGWWSGFPFWTSMGLCALGGILGVMYTIPLRRALVSGSDLPYPEGVACAEVLKVGATDNDPAGRTGLMAVVWGALTAALFSLGIAMKLFADGVSHYFRLGDNGSASGFHFSLSFALFAVGHLVGLWVGLSMLLGALIAWGWAVPHYSALLSGTGAAADIAHAAWSTKVRFIGAGAIGMAAVWTLLRLVRPVAGGLLSALAASRARHQGRGGLLPRTEQDLPIGIVALVSVLCLLPLAALLAHFAVDAGLHDDLGLLVGGSVVFLVLIGFLVATVCGYMAGLIGSSNSPLSGIGILVVVIAALLLVLLNNGLNAENGKPWVAFALFLTSLVFAVATIANDNLQDLKTGQLVDATPWKQQVALIIGVLAGAVIIPPVLDLLNQAYGFAGTPGAGPHALPAPQAGLISALAEGVIRNNVDWHLLGLGMAIGAVLIVIDELLARQPGPARLPPLAVGLGIYLPTATTLMIGVGALSGWLFDRRAATTEHPDQTRRLGVLLASGMIVGEGIIGVLLAALVVFSGQPAPLALAGPGFATAALWLGAVVFVAMITVLYGWVRRR